MPIATTHYVTWISRGRRHHGSAYTDMASPTQSSLTADDTFQTPWASPSISWVDTNGDMHTASFAFWSVAGGVEGGVISNAGSNTAPPVTVGSSNIVATAWYIEGGPGGNGQPGVLIHAFDVNQGILEIAAKQISLASQEIQNQMLSYNKVHEGKITVRKIHV